ncbi:MAG: trypsin-like serine protease [Deltaproteobacteria bacterium]|nr:MAG: trypsin-like serine protease [Deltaproteobacteria bacterium]
MAPRLPALLLLVGGLLLAGCPSEHPPGYFAPPSLPPPRYDTRPPLPLSPDVVEERDVVEPDAVADVVVPTADTAGPGPSPNPVDTVPSFVSLFRELSPSVVNIYTQEVVTRRQRNSPLTLTPEQYGTSLGSGMVLDREGLILTNAHVVENAAEIRVRFHDEDEMPARLVGIDPIRDLALLKVDGAKDLQAVVPGNSDDVEVGDWVVAIGNPFGLSHTMTKGIVSGTGRAEFVNDRMGYLDLIQTDAAINQGSSGGPLFDMQGRVIGVNTAVNAEGHGIGFAIQWRAVEEALPRLMQGGQVSRSWLGVYILPRGNSQSGVLVDAVVDDSPASQAGLKPGDIIFQLDGRPVKDVAEFRLRVASAVAMKQIDVQVLRDGEPVTLTARPQEARDIR